MPETLLDAMELIEAAVDLLRLRKAFDRSEWTAMGMGGGGRKESPAWPVIAPRLVVAVKEPAWPAGLAAETDRRGDLFLLGVGDVGLRGVRP